MAAWEQSSSSTICFLSPLSNNVYKHRHNILKGVEAWLMKALWNSSFSLLCKAELTTTQPPRINWKSPLKKKGQWGITWPMLPSSGQICNHVFGGKFENSKTQVRIFVLLGNIFQTFRSNWLLVCIWYKQIDHTWVFAARWDRSEGLLLVTLPQRVFQYWVGLALVTGGDRVQDLPPRHVGEQ